MAVAVRDRTNPISSTAMRLEPLGARSAHVMTFRAVTLDWLEHWRSPSPINCTEAASTGNANWLSTPQRATPDRDPVGLVPNGSTLLVPLSGSNDSTMNRGHSVGAKRVAILNFCDCCGEVTWPLGARCQINGMFIQILSMGVKSPIRSRRLVLPKSHKPIWC